MSIRRFNYTDRQRLAQRDVAIYMVDDGDSYSFDAAFDWDSYDLPTQARVIVEAYRQTTVRRYAFGNVADTRAENPTTLEDFGESSGVLFRIKVVDVDGSGRLLAAADKLHGADPKSANRLSLVRVADADLDDEIWRLSFDDGAPLLELDRRFVRETLLNSPHFKCLIYPQLLREMLRQALDERADSDEDESSWQSKAIFFAERLCKQKAPSDEAGAADNARDEWITTAVTAFCKRHGLARKYADMLNGGGDG